MHDALSRYSKAIYSADGLRAGLGLLSNAANELGFEGVGCVLWPAASVAAESPAPQVVLNSPEMGPGMSHWGVRYLDHGIFRHDFGFRLCRRSAVPALWSCECLPEIVPGIGWSASRQEIDAVTHLRQLTGVRGAIVVPIHTPAGMFGYAAFPSKQSLPYLMQRRERCERQLFGMTHRFVDAMTLYLGVETASACDLSPRELRCLTLMASGETIEGAAAALGLSYGTIRFHLYNAERKLGTCTRSHAIARAAALGLLGRLN
jgi:DNA-binding CsgD family transcriptional regulator